MTKNLYKITAAILAILFFKSALPAAINISVSPDAWTVPANPVDPSPQFTITNAGEQVRINARASNTDAWRLSNMGRLNAFAIAWRDSGDWTSLSTKDSTMFTSVAAGASRPFTLKYSSPTYTIPNINGNAQTSNVTLTAVSSYMGNMWHVNNAALDVEGRDALVAMDAAGEFHVAYSSAAPHYLVYSAIGDSPDFVPVEQMDLSVNPGSSINSVNPISLIMDNNGRPHILYWVEVVNGGPSYRLMYAWRNNNRWVISEVVSDYLISGDVGPLYSSVSFALDSSNLPHIAYTYYNYTGGLSYTHYNGSEWSTGMFWSLIR